MRFPAIEPATFFGTLVFSGLLAAGAALVGCAAEDAAGPGSDALITLTSPKGGETFKIGDTLWITWTTRDATDPVEAVDPLISPDSGKTWINMRSGSIPITSTSWGKWGWQVKDTVTHVSSQTKFPLAGNSKVFVKVQQYQSADPKKISVTPRPITIAAP